MNTSNDSARLNYLYATADSKGMARQDMDILISMFGIDVAEEALRKSTKATGSSPSIRFKGDAAAKLAQSKHTLEQVAKLYEVFFGDKDTINGRDVLPTASSADYEGDRLAKALPALFVSTTPARPKALREVLPGLFKN